MSYDIRVYGRVSLTRPQIVELLHSSSFAAGTASEDKVITVTRGNGQRYTFSLEGPAALDWEDVPDHIIALTLEPHYLYGISVEGSSATGIRHAVRFAARLAHAVTGVVDDPQTESKRRGPNLRAAPVHSGDAHADVLVMTWCTPAQNGSDIARAWLACARPNLPEALPRRFGVFEPLQSSLARDGDQAFVDLAATAQPFMSLLGSTPCLDGVLSNNMRRAGITAHRLLVLDEPLAERAWSAAVRRFFAGFAAASSAIFASAEVQSDIRWNGRHLSYGPDSEFTVYLAPMEKWMGLPPYPVCWAWLGLSYLDVLDGALPQAFTEVHSRGTLLSFVDRPAPRGDLPASALFPDQFRARYAEPPTRGASIALVPATRAPTWW